MAELVLKGVSKEYPGGVLAVRNVTLEVKDKEFLVLAGPSGCGKSPFYDSAPPPCAAALLRWRKSGSCVGDMLPRPRHCAAR